jgi:hypothetical protein
MGAVRRRWPRRTGRLWGRCTPVRTHFARHRGPTMGTRRASARSRRGVGRAPGRCVAAGPGEGLALITLPKRFPSVTATGPISAAARTAPRACGARSTARAIVRDIARPSMRTSRETTLLGVPEPRRLHRTALFAETVRRGLPRTDSGLRRPVDVSFSASPCAYKYTVDCVYTSTTSSSLKSVVFLETVAACARSGQIVRRENRE